MPAHKPNPNLNLSKESFRLNIFLMGTIQRSGPHKGKVFFFLNKIKDPKGQKSSSSNLHCFMLMRTSGPYKIRNT